MELRNELEKRIKELGEFKEEIRQAGKMVRRDPLQQGSSDTFVSAQRIERLQIYNGIGNVFNLIYHQVRLSRRVQSSPRVGPRLVRNR